jgi:uncharacterized protein YndB with AHSA1/START domain
MFDLSRHLGAMSRAVRNLVRDGVPMKAVVASCVYDTDAADLWDALTSPERLPRWFLPVSGDLKLGGHYQFEGNAGGTVTECVPHKKIAATWEFAGGISWVTLTLTPEGERTRLELEHVAPVDPHWGQFGPGAVGVGWDMGFMGLARHLAEPRSAVAADGAAWMASPEAKDYIRQTSDAWGAADIAAGENRATALAAAEATRRAYSGEPAAGA